MNGFETEHSVWNRVNENLPKVVPVKCCDDSVYPKLLQCIVGIEGSQEPDDIAKKISDTAQFNKKVGCGFITRGIIVLLKIEA